MWTHGEPSFATTTYFKQVDITDGILGTREKLEDAVVQLVFSHAVQLGLPQKQVTAFCQRLISSVPSKESLMSTACRLWVSDHQFRGKGVHGLVNAAFRADRNPTLLFAQQFLDALSHLSFREVATESDMEWLFASGCVFRGGYIPECHKAFFTKGQRFRSPMALSTYFDVNAARMFAQKKQAPADGRPPVLWTIQLDSAVQHMRAYLLEPSVSGSSDRELLFGPYNCFVVVHVEWEDEAIADTPHRIDLLACSESTAGSEWWPSAPWG